MKEKKMVVKKEKLSEGEKEVEKKKDIEVKKKKEKIGIMRGENIENIVKGINKIGVKKKGIIEILKEIKK